MFIPTLDAEVWIASDLDEAERLRADLPAVGLDGTRARLQWLRSELPEPDRLRRRSEAEDGDPTTGLILAAVATSPEPAAWLLWGTPHA